MLSFLQPVGITALYTDLVTGLFKYVHNFSNMVIYVLIVRLCFFL